MWLHILFLVVPPARGGRSFRLSRSLYGEITDTTTNVETDIHDATNTINSCPDADGNLTLFVVDASGGVVLEAGPYTQLQPVELQLQPVVQRQVAVLVVRDEQVAASAAARKAGPQGPLFFAWLLRPRDAACRDA